MLGLIGTAAVVLLILVLLGWPSPAPAQKAAEPTTPANMPPGHVGAEMCKNCHEEAFNRFSNTKMGRLFLKQPRNSQEASGCESCHGPGQDHVDAGGKGPIITFAKNDPTPVEKRNAMCLSCHTKGNRVFWSGSSHDARNIACTNCHTVMENHSSRNNLAKETEIETCGSCHLQKRATTMRSSHMPLREGKMTCTSCHNPHGTVTPALLRENSLNDNCYRCHTEKRGPFLWQHAPVIESCANCHDPHGSNHEKMLKVAKPRLCQQCHIESRHPTSPYGRDPGSAKFVMSGSCVNCHVNIHGSNHPSGFAFTR
jgi:DmsE family decaheme c-type cytochrome